ncbi:MAG: RNA polymerase sigma factor RpoH [Candidatus Methanosuratincola sp.]|jgi:RNA polymerase sigma-32 factor
MEDYESKEEEQPEVEIAEEKAREGIERVQLPVPTTSIERYLAEISSYPILSREEEMRLAKKYREEGDLDAARKLITSNLKFVVKIANEYKNYGLPLMDIIQEGNIGLMNAVKKFDPTKGYRLISYAVWWIRAYIQNYIIRTWSLVKVGTTQAQRKLFYKLRSTKRKLEITDKYITPEEYESLAEELGVTEEEVEEMEKRLAAKDVSLDAEINGETTHMDFLPNDRSVNQETLISQAEEDEAIKSGLKLAMATLKEREKYIIKHRILAEKPMTLEEIGKKLNISRERVRQIENAALAKIRALLEKQGVTG